MAILEVKHLTKDFGSGRGIFDVSFEIQKGEVFGFLGPNGAGKTTTIRHLMGFTHPGQGNTTINGLDSSKDYAKIMQQVGYLPGEIALPEGLTGWQFIRMMQKMRKSTNEAHLQSLLKRFELDPSGSMKRMSLGNKRKLAIVTAFMHDPEILILDEPTSGLDPVMQERFVQFMLEEKKRGKTILLSSHIFPEIEATCDRISIIKEGRIVSEVMADQVKNQSNKVYELQVSTMEELDILQTIFPSQDMKVLPNKLTLKINIKKENLNDFFQTLTDYNIKKFKEVQFNLESYFLDFYKSDKNFGGMN